MPDRWASADSWCDFRKRLAKPLAFPARPRKKKAAHFLLDAKALIYQTINSDQLSKT